MVVVVVENRGEWFKIRFKCPETGENSQKQPKLGVYGSGIDLFGCGWAITVKYEWERSKIDARAQKWLNTSIDGQKWSKTGGNS
jgi:hypothetical protein